jgi:hypothetical protein
MNCLSDIGKLHTIPITLHVSLDADEEPAFGEKLLRKLFNFLKMSSIGSSYFEMSFVLCRKF